MTAPEERTVLDLMADVMMTEKEVANLFRENAAKLTSVCKTRFLSRKQAKVELEGSLKRWAGSRNFSTKGMKKLLDRTVTFALRDYDASLLEVLRSEDFESLLPDELKKDKSSLDRWILLRTIESNAQDYRVWLNRTKSQRSRPKKTS